MDAATISKTRPSMAKVRVELDLLKSHPDSVWVGLEDEDSPLRGFTQKLEYEAIPKYCKHGKKIGHTMTNCKILEKIWPRKRKKKKKKEEEETMERTAELVSQDKEADNDNSKKKNDQNEQVFNNNDNRQIASTSKALKVANGKTKKEKSQKDAKKEEQKKQNNTKAGNNLQAEQVQQKENQDVQHKEKINPKIKVNDIKNEELRAKEIDKNLPRLQEDQNMDNCSTTEERSSKEDQSRTKKSMSPDSFSSSDSISREIRTIPGLNLVVDLGLTEHIDKTVEATHLQDAGTEKHINH
ncbi:putative protein MAL13P1.-like [Capsicum annuum]|uniref:uncharacterized protein MAL13P1.304-like n=1 Tax=Capsicum annuum TaxID=4072 RepID=UPI001FB10228|nr:uncharacterized protein MAL13P1.304-like [Capsicum annuum]